MNYKRIASFLIVFLLLWFSCTSSAQLQTQTVLLHVRVTDATDKAVLDVAESSFQVTEDGVPQKITLFMNKEIPLNYGLVIDASGSLRSQFPQVIRTAKKIIASNKDSDATFIVRFVSSSIMEVAQELTSSKEELFKALDGFYIEGGPSAVVDAVYLSAQKLSGLKNKSGELRRNILILVTDGEDRVSFYNQDQLFQLLASNDIQIFTIGLTKELKGGSKDKAIDLLMKLGGDTGGRTFFPASSGDIERISSDIISDIRTQYVIGYEPSGGDPRKEFHKVQVAIIENPNQEKRAAITRVGYQRRSGEESP